MLLKKLIEYERSKPSDPDYYTRANVRWICHLTKAGDFVKWERLSVDKSDKEKDQPVEMLVPTATKGNAPFPLLLSDTAEYVLGHSDLTREKKAAAYSKCFRDQLDAAHEAKFAPDLVGPVRAALPTLTRPINMQPKDRIVFQVGKAVVTDDRRVRDYWAASRTADLASGTPAPCSCCGETRPHVRIVPDRLLGVPDALQGKCALVSANAESTEKYGKTQAAVAGLCYPCVRDAMRGLNALIASPQTVKVAGLLVITWGVAEMPPLVHEALAAPVATTEPALQLWAGDVEGGMQDVCVLVLGARMSRAVVRSFDVFKAGDLAQNLADWLKVQETPVPLIDAWASRDNKKFKQVGVVNAVHPTGNASAVAVSTVQGIIETALRGTPLPPIAAAATRLAERGGYSEAITATAIVALTNRFRIGGVVSDVNTADTPAYRCGQLLGYIEQVQRAAIPDVNRSVADRVIRSAASTPRAVLGKAMLDMQAHLSKLDRNRRGSQFREMIDQATQGLEIPERFSTADTAAFMLGYSSVANAPRAKKK